MGDAGEGEVKREEEGNEAEMVFGGGWGSALAAERGGGAAVVGRRWRWGGIAENGGIGNLLITMISCSLIKPFNLLIHAYLFEAIVNTISS